MRWSIAPSVQAWTEVFGREVEVLRAAGIPSRIHRRLRGGSAAAADLNEAPTNRGGCPLVWLTRTIPCRLAGVVRGNCDDISHSGALIEFRVEDSWLVCGRIIHFRLGDCTVPFEHG